MKADLQKWWRWTGSRVARNIYFWAFLVITKLDSVAGHKYCYPESWYYALNLLTLSFFGMLSVVNNGWLVPRLLTRKRYPYYLASAVVLTWCGGFFYTWLLKFILFRFPGITPIQVSIVGPPLSTDLSLLSVYHEMETATVSVVVWVLVHTLLWFVNDYSGKLKRMKEEEKKRIETELYFLRTQINPHFLFNTLNNLYGLALKKSDEAPEAILKLSSVLRYVLYESDAELIAFEKEKEIMQAYIDIEMLRLPEDGQLQFSILADQPRDIPPLLWLPVLENVFKHGTTFISDRYCINFRFELKEDTLRIFAENSLKLTGELNEPKKPGGIGLANLSKRLELLYPGKHCIETGIAEQMYRIEVKVNLG